MVFKFSKKQPFILLYLISNIIIVSGKTDCDTLSGVYRGLQYESAVTWGVDSIDCCTADGIKCDENHKITKIELQNKGLKGFISNEITNLAELTVIDFRRNNIGGTIPTSIDSLSKLVFFNIGNNINITGNIPYQLCSLKNLIELYLYGNKLTGEIPSCIGGLTNLIELCLDNNQLEGNIPSDIGYLSKLDHLDLENNHLTGVIPTSLTKLTKLEKINLGGNPGLQGVLPEIPSIKDCVYTNTNLCIKEGFNACSGNLRKCTDEDIKKTNNYNNDDAPIGVIILIISPIVLIILFCIYFLYKRKSKKNKNDGFSSSEDAFLPSSLKELSNASKSNDSIIIFQSNPTIKQNSSINGSTGRADTTKYMNNTSFNNINDSHSLMENMTEVNAPSFINSSNSNNISMTEHQNPKNNYQNIDLNTATPQELQQHIQYLEQQLQHHQFQQQLQQQIQNLQQMLQSVQHIPTSDAQVGQNQYLDPNCIIMNNNDKKSYIPHSNIKITSGLNNKLNEVNAMKKEATNEFEEPPPNYDEVINDQIYISSISSMNSYTGTTSNANPNTNSNPNTNTDTETTPDANTNSNTNTNTETTPDANTNSNTNTNTNTTDANTNSNSTTTDINTTSNTNANINSSNSNNNNTDTTSNGNTNTNTTTNTSTDINSTSTSQNINSPKSE